MTQTSVQNSETHQILQWEKATLLLSLDRVSAFWQDMGLRLPDKECVKKTTRRVLTEQQRQPHDDTLEISAHIDTMLSRIRTDCGTEAEDAIRRWITQIYSVFLQKEQWYECWQILFLRLAEGDLAQLAGQEISDEKLTAFKHLVERWRDVSEDINTRIDEADAEPLTGWDAEQYECYRREAPDISPLDYLSTFLNNYAFSPFWEALINLLSPEEVAVLNRWGQLYTALRTSIPPAWAEIPPQYIRSPFAHT